MKGHGSRSAIFRRRGSCCCCCCVRSQNRGVGGRFCFVVMARRSFLLRCWGVFAGKHGKEEACCPVVVMVEVGRRR